MAHPSFGFFCMAVTSYVCAPKVRRRTTFFGEKARGCCKLTSTYKTYSTVRMDMDLMDLMDPRIIWTWGLLVGHFFGGPEPGIKISPGITAELGHLDSSNNSPRCQNVTPWNFSPTRNGRFCHVYGWYKPSKYIKWEVYS